MPLAFSPGRNATWNSGNKEGERGDGGSRRPIGIEREEEQDRRGGPIKSSNPPKKPWRGKKTTSGGGI